VILRLASDPIWRFWTQAWTSFVGLFAWFTPFPFVSNVFVSPFVQIALFSYVTRFTTGHYASDNVILGMSMLSMTWIMYGGILQSFQYEREYGTLTVLLASRGSRMLAYWTRGALHYADGVLAASVTLTAAVLVFHVDAHALRPMTVSLAVLAGGASCTAFGLFGGNFSLVYRNWLVLIGVTNGSMLTFTGAIIPRTSLPHWLFVLSEGLPLTHALSALRMGFAGVSAAGSFEQLVLELAVAGGYGFVGMALYRWIEYRARVRGDFDE
jgi:hypothetical protein